MSTIAELLVKISADNSDLKKELNASKRQLKSLERELPKLVPKNTATLLAGFGASMAAAGVGAIKLAADMEQTKIAFTTMLGSAEKADTMIKDLADFAAKTPFELTGLINSSKKLLAFGFQAQEIIPMMTSIGDSVAAVGGSAQTLDQVTLAFGQMRTKGMVSAQEMNQLANAGLPAWEMLAKAIGKDVPTAMSLAEKKALNANAAISAMLQEMATRYGGMMEKQSNTVTGQLSNIQDIATRTATNIGKQLTEAFEIKQALSSASEQLETFGKQIEEKGVGKVLRELVPDQVIIASMTAVSIYAAARFIPTITAIKNALLGARLAAIAFNTALGPVGWAVAGATFVYGEYYMAIGQANEEAAKAAVLKRDLANLTAKEREEQEKLNQVIFDGASRMHLAGDQANTLANKLVGIGDSAYYAADAMRAMTSMADFRRSEDSNTLPPITPYYAPPPTPPPTPPASVGAIITGAAEKSKAAKALEELQEKAESVSKSIETEWVQTTHSQLGQLDYWKAKQEDALKEVMSAVKDYNGNLGKINEIYAERNRKILQDEAAYELSVRRSLADDVRDFWKESSTSKLKGSAAFEFTVNEDAAGKIRSMKREFEDLAIKWETATDAERDSIRGALIESKISFKEIKGIGGDKISFHKEIEERQAEITRQAEEQKTEYHRQARGIQADLDEAYNNGRVNEFKSILNREAALELQSLQTRQSIMDTYQQAMLDKTRTTAELMADLYDQGLGGLKDTFADIFMDVHNAESALRSFGKTLLQVVANHYAAILAGQIMTGLIGEKGAKDQMKTDALAGAATAAAWWPAAIARTLATGGGNVGPAIAGMAAASAAGMALANISAFASGGYLRGPGTGTSDSILARLSNREFVMNAEATESIGVGNLNYMNQTGQIPGFADGGIVTGPSLASLGASRYATAPSFRSEDLEKSTAVGEGQAGNSLTIHVTAMDGKSVESWLNNRGGKLIAKYFQGRARNFDTLGVKI